MQQIPNPMANMYQTQLEASRRLAEAIFSGTERLDRVVIEATHQAFNDQLSFVQALTAGGDLRDAGVGLQANMLQRNTGEAVNYQAEIIRIVSDIQNEIGKSMQEYIAQMGAQAAAAPGQAAQTAKAQQGQTSDAMTNPMTSMFSVWESAFKGVADLAARNMSMARSNVERAVDTAGGAARSATRAAEGASEGAAHTTRKTHEDADERKGGKSK